MTDALAKDIDALYQLPLAAFTAARNALASTAGQRKAEIQQLRKPKPAAWAVNQVFWRHRAAFEALVAASLAVRQAHVARMSGKDVDVAALESRYAAALDQARTHASSALAEAGSVSPATMEAVDKTLAALPAPEAAGRLVEPLESVGFGLLSGLLATKAADLRGMGAVISLPGRSHKGESHPGTKSRGGSKNGSSDKASEQDAARAAARLRREERRRLEKRLAAATAAEAATRQAFTRGRQAAERAEARIERLEADLRKSRAEAEERRLDLDRLRGEANDAAAERAECERALRLLGD